METVTLLHPHTHASRQYSAGDSITVDEGTAKWLREQGVVAKVSTTKSVERVETPIKSAFVKEK